jgi:phytoene synthase
VASRDELVMQAVRDADPDRYLSVLYAPEPKRPALFALYAFNAEIASVRDRIHEALPGEVRLQWWRDTLAAGQEGTGHPVADALLAAIGQYELPVGTLQNYLDARVFDLYDDPMPSRNDLEGYCGETASALIQLAAVILDPVAAPRFAALAGHAGCAQAIAGLLRMLPLHLARGQCFIPRDILAAAGTTPEQFVSKRDGASDGRVVDAMVALCGEHMSAFNRGAAKIEPSLRPAFLPLSLVPAYLRVAERKGAGVTAAPIQVPAWHRQWRLFRTATRGW